MRSQQPMLLAVVVTVVAFQLSSAAVLRDGVEVPTYTSPCIRNTPEFNQCIRKSLQLLMGKLSKSGIKELGLESVDPLSIAELEMTYNGGDPVIGADVTLKDTITRGFSAIKVIDVRSKTDDPNFFGMDIDFYVPRIVTNGKYKMEGHVGNYPVNGAGGFNITTTEVTGTWKLRGTPIVEDGETYIRIDRMTVRPEIGGLKAHASNLINDNPELSQIVLAFVNRFWKVLYQEMIPYAEEHFEKILKGIVNKIFLKIPYDQLFPPARLQ